MLRQTYQRGRRSIHVWQESIHSGQFSPIHFQQQQIKHKLTIIVLGYVTLLSVLSGFLYMRNKQGTEYCKTTAHISNSSPLLLMFAFSVVASSHHFLISSATLSLILACRDGWVSKASSYDRLDLFCVVNDSFVLLSSTVYELAF